MKFVQQQFFPSSDRDELIIDWSLPQNASIIDTNAQMARFEREQLQGNAGVDHWSTYVGTGAPRFVLSFDVQTANSWFGQMVVVTKGGIAARDRLKAQFETYLKRTFPGTDTFVKLLEVGPPVGRPVQYRLSGPDIAQVKEFSQKLAGIMRTNPYLENVVFDWMEPARVAKVDVLQDKARQLGVSSEDIATTMNGVLNGARHPGPRQYLSRERHWPAPATTERASIDTLQNLQLSAATDSPCRLAPSPDCTYGIEQPTIWRRTRLPTITLKADVPDTAQPKTVVDRARAEGYGFREVSSARLFGRGRRLCRGEREEPGADRGGRSAYAFHHGHDPDDPAAELPAPVLGVCDRAAGSDRRGRGSTAEWRSPMGFVAILGVLALIGILIRNSVILIVQIEL